MKKLLIPAILLVLTVLFGFIESAEANENNRLNESYQTNQVGSLLLTSEGIIIKPLAFQTEKDSLQSVMPQRVLIKGNSQKIIKVSNSKLAKKYYVTNPKLVIGKKKLTVYKKKNFTKKNYKKTYAEGTVLKVKKITKSSTGYPRLELTNGYFVSANKSNVLKISAAAQESFYTANENVNQIMTLKDLKIYKSATATTKGKTIPKYTVFTGVKLAYNGSGENRFRLKDGQFISASKNDVVKVPDTIENYYRYERNDLQTQRAVYSYDNLMFGETNNSKLLPIGTNIQVVAVVYNKLGYPRFQLENGEYVSTKKTLYKQIPWYQQ